MIYCFDLDNTICTTIGKDYMGAVPHQDMINDINLLFEAGNTILVMTARGTTSKIDWKQKTEEQLISWGLSYHSLICGVKPNADLFIDDKAIHIDDWRNQRQLKRGFIAGAFDILHPGYIQMFKEASKICDSIVVGLHIDPSFENPDKYSPIFSVKERKAALFSLKNVNEVWEYTTESELDYLIKRSNPHVRIVGSDYLGKEEQLTGYEHCKNIHFHDRSNHGWSYSKLREKLRMK